MRPKGKGRRDLGVMACFAGSSVRPVVVGVMLAVTAACGGETSRRELPEVTAESAGGSGAGAEETLSVTGSDGAPLAARARIADFLDPMSLRNNLGGDFNEWASSQPKAYARHAVVDGAGLGGGKPGWRIEYDIQAPGAHAGVWMALMGIPVAQDSLFVINIRGEGAAFSTDILLELKTHATEGLRVGRARVTGIGSGYRTIAVPLRDFAGLMPVPRLDEFAIVLDSETARVRAGAYVVDKIDLR